MLMCTGVSFDAGTACCFSGHRFIKNSDLELIKKNLIEIIKNLYAEGFRVFLSGGAIGFDTMAAEAVISLRNQLEDIRLVMALPCRNQDIKWTAGQKRLYNKVLSLADEVIYVSESYTAGCMHKRNRFMVDSSSAVVTYITHMGGGTAYTLNYALNTGGRRIINVLTMQ